MYLIPNRLNLGDTLALIAPASPPPNPAAIDESVAALESLGFKVKLGKNARKRLGFLAGTAKERAADLMTAFKDKRIHGISCVRGGYGCPQILPLLDYEVIKKNPKVLIGYSDITALNCAILKKSNLVTFHGPLAVEFSAAKNCPAFTKNSWLSTLTVPGAYGSILQGYQDDTVTVIRKGTVTGELLGGNLSLLGSLVGTPYLPSFKNKILFFEDVDEKPYRIDRMLTHLLNAGLLQQVKGIAIGLCHDCTDPRAKTANEYRQTALDVFKNLLLPLKIPVVVGLPFGHVPMNAPLPVGIKATLDANKGDLIIKQAATI